MKSWRQVGCGMVVIGVLAMGVFGGSASAAEPAPDEPSHGLFGDRFSLDVGWKFWVAKWQAAGSVGAINSTRTSDTTTLTGPSITGSVRLRDDEFLHSLGVNFTWLQAGGFDFSSFGLGPTDVTSAIRRDYSVVGTLAIWRGSGSSAATIICSSGSAASFSPSPARLTARSGSADRSSVCMGPERSVDR